MFNAFGGKGIEKSDEAAKTVVEARGLVVTEDDPDTAWGLWDSAMVDMDSRFSEISTDTAYEASGQFSTTGPMRLAVDDLDTQPAQLEEKSLEQRKNDALQIVEMHHYRIASAIRTLWGHAECSVFIHNLIMNGGDGMGKARIGLNWDAANAILVLADLQSQG
jgi:hypothetical protein